MDNYTTRGHAVECTVVDFQTYLVVWKSTNACMGKKSITFVHRWKGVGFVVGVEGFFEQLWVETRTHEFPKGGELVSGQYCQYALNTPEAMTLSRDLEVNTSFLNVLVFSSLDADAAAQTW